MEKGLVLESILTSTVLLAGFGDGGGIGIEQAATKTTHSHIQQYLVPNTQRGALEGKPTRRNSPTKKSHHSRNTCPSTRDQTSQPAYLCLCPCPDGEGTTPLASCHQHLHHRIASRVTAMTP